MHSVSSGGEVGVLGWSRSLLEEVGSGTGVEFVGGGTTGAEFSFVVGCLGFTRDKD